MANQLVRIKVVNPTSQPLSNALVRILSFDGILQAQGLTSEGPIPAEGIFETILSGSATPGSFYEVDVHHPFLNRRARAQIGVLS